MQETFSFELKWKLKKATPIRIRVFFTGNIQLPPSHLANDISTVLDRSVPPDHVLVMTTEGCHEQLKAVVLDRLFSEKLPSITRHSNPPRLHTGTMSANGNLVSDSSEPWVTAPEFVEALKHDGLVEIFSKRNGVLQPNPLFHFAKPSGKHSLEFIRTAELLVADGEISFIAATLLPWISRPGLRHIFCDTSSIAVLGYAAAQMLSTAIGKDYIFPRIHSFSSYDGVKNLQLSSADDALFLISSSTSGDLAQRILNLTKVSPERMVTLFYLGEDIPPGKTLCDLKKPRALSQKGLNAIISYSAKECPLCKKGSTRLYVLGDHFVPKEHRVEECLVRATHAPLWLSPFMKEMHGTGVVRCHYDRGKLDDPAEIYLELSPLFVGNNNFSIFREKLRRIANQSIPAALKRIVYLDDDASKSLAKYIHRLFKSNFKKNSVQLISAGIISKDPSAHILDQGVTLVVGSCLVTGRGLQAASQALRNIQENDSICYLIGLSRTQTKKDLDEVRSNLSFGRTGANEHPFQIIHSIYLPDSVAVRRSPWSEEEILLRRVKENWQISSEAAIKGIENRLNALENASSRTVKGLVNNVFWSRFDGKTLRLRRNFAFFSFDHDHKKVSQADVYLTVASILHRLRISEDQNEAAKNDALINHIHHRTLLSPRCFDRFNDGIIQAAFLRATTRAELDFRLHPKMSADMRDILLTVAKHRNTEMGEAFFEFLMALADGKLRLIESDSAVALRAFAKYSAGNADAKAICDYSRKMI